MFAVDVNFCTLPKSQGSQTKLNQILLDFVGGGKGVGWGGGNVKRYYTITIPSLF